MQNTTRHPLSGATYLLRGMRALTHPGIRLFVVIPLAINTVVFATLLWFAATWIGTFMDSQMERLPEWLQWLDWLIWLALATALWLFGFSLFTFLANLISAPFNGFLAEAVETRLYGRNTSDRVTVTAVLKDIVPALKEELRKILYFAKWAVPFLILFLIPGVNLIAAPLWIVFSAWMLALQYADYPMSNNGLAFAEQRQRLAKTRFLSLTFGASVMLGTMIPLVNFLIIPSAVAGATMMWRERLSDNLSRGS